MGAHDAFEFAYNQLEDVLTIGDISFPVKNFYTQKFRMSIQLKNFYDNHIRKIEDPKIIQKIAYKYFDITIPNHVLYNTNWLTSKLTMNNKNQFIITVDREHVILISELKVRYTYYLYELYKFPDEDNYYITGVFKIPENIASHLSKEKYLDIAHGINVFRGYNRVNNKLIKDK